MPAESWHITPADSRLHHRAQFLNGRDLYGELAAAAHKDGLAVLARMGFQPRCRRFLPGPPGTGSRATAAASPTAPRTSTSLAVNSPYYDEYIPAVLRRDYRTIEAPRGLTDNSWAGLGARLHSATAPTATVSSARAPASRFPSRADWDDPAYREWILWN